MSGAGVELPSTDPPTDDDRRRVINLLRTAGGQIGLEEAEQRMDAALRAATRGELALLVWDLPDAVAATPPGTARPRARAWKNVAFRLHGTVYGMVNGMLVGIWALTDSHDIFWPFFPIAGWGIGLGAHAVLTRAAQRRQYGKEVRRLERADPARLAASSPALTASATPARSSATAKVVVMFTDVVDSTRLTMVIGDEDWTRLRRRYREMLHECYGGCRGREVSSHGDGFLARFERPSDAVRCAVTFQRKLQDQRDQTGFAPAVRIGINAGEAVEEEGDVLGTTVNLAARVTQAADPNEILITEVVADGLDDSFGVTDGGLREMKGLNRSAHVLIVTW